ncbi:hypothetical protein RRG08_049209, partial [Elysia crispata]
LCLMHKIDLVHLCWMPPPVLLSPTLNS